MAGDERGAGLPGQSPHNPVAVDHRLEIVVDLEGPLQLELLVVVDRVGGEDDRPVRPLDEQYGLARGVTPDADRLDAGSDLLVAFEQAEVAGGNLLGPDLKAPADEA